MDYAKKTLTFYVGFMAVGLIALLITLIYNLPDDYIKGIIYGIAGAFTITGILGVVVSIRLLKDPQRAMEVEIAKTEERTQYIRLKTNSAIYKIMIYVESAGILFAALFGFREASLTIAILLIVQVALIVGFTAYYAKKY